MSYADTRSRGCWPYPALADRAWQLRGTLTIYDGSYVALAELLGAPLIALDLRLQLASGPRCDVRVPSHGPGSSPLGTN